MKNLIWLLVIVTLNLYGLEINDYAQTLSSAANQVELEQKLATDQNFHEKLEENLNSKDFKSGLFLIQKLKKKNFIRKLFHLADEEEKDISFGVINSLIDDENKKIVEEFYKNKEYKIHEKGHSYFKMAFFEAANKLDLKIKIKILKKILKDESFEVRFAVEDYFFKHIDQYSKIAQKKMINVLLKSSPYQLRMHTLLDLSKLKTDQKKDLGDSFIKCENDQNDEVKVTCNEVKNNF